MKKRALNWIELNDKINAGIASRKVIIRFPNGSVSDKPLSLAGWAKARRLLRKEFDGKLGGAKGKKP